MMFLLPLQRRRCSWIVIKNMRLCKQKGDLAIKFEKNTGGRLVLTVDFYGEIPILLSILKTIQLVSRGKIIFFTDLFIIARLNES